MKNLLVFSIILLVSCNSMDDFKNKASTLIQTTGYDYDSLLAKKYGADDYGMKKYVMAFLKKGPNRDLDSAEAAELQKIHLENIIRMAEEGKLVLAGPFFGNGEIRGIYIFNVETINEAKMLTETDPAIQAGSLEMELKEWYGSAALVAVNEIHKTLAKRGITDE